MELYLLKYNNYYNRQIKFYSALSDYLVTPYYNNTTVTGVNFNPNDNVNTEQVLNIATDEYDYLLVCNGNDIVSR